MSGRDRPFDYGAPRQFVLGLAAEMIIDLFAGGGGASTGIHMATGRHPDVAVNHDPAAVSLHQINHPQTMHYVCDVFEVDPLAVTEGRPVGLLWMSPDCKHFSKAKGGKPVSKKIRGLAGVGIKWVKATRPRIIFLENVEEFQTWGPLLKDGTPCPARKGKTFHRWVARLRNLGYVVEWKELRACDYGVPTSRKRLYLIARCDGEPIVWPEPTHGPGLLPYRTAAECIDWSIPCPSIFLSKEEGRALGVKRPLADATMRRIAHGVKRYVLEAADPFIVPVTRRGDDRVHSAREPLRTVTAARRGEFALVTPTFGVADESKRGLVAAFMAQHNTGMVGHPMTAPVSTIVGKGCTQALVTSNLAVLRGTSNSAATDEPLHTVSAQGQHHAEVRALLLKYYGTDQDPRLDEPLHTVTTKARFALVTVAGEVYAIADIGMRMLRPRELYRAQGFPDTYVIDRGADGRQLTQEEQIRMCGNSVCPPMAAALVSANFEEFEEVSVSSRRLAA